MKHFLLSASVLLLTCLTGRAFAQYLVTNTFYKPGTYNWTPPPNADTVYITLWGSGGGLIKQQYAGGGGAFAHSKAIPVTQGQTYTVVVGAGGTPAYTQGGNSSFALNSSIYIYANGGQNRFGGAVSSGVYVASSFPGGNGYDNSLYVHSDFHSGGGGAAAGMYGPGQDGGLTYPLQAGAGQDGGGSGGDIDEDYGGFPGGGGGRIAGGSGSVMIMCHFTTISSAVFTTPPQFSADPGTYKWTVPSNVKTIYVVAWGAGGSSVSGQPGGGGACTISKPLQVTPGQVFDVAVPWEGSGQYLTTFGQGADAYGQGGNIYLSADIGRIAGGVATPVQYLHFTPVGNSVDTTAYTILSYSGGDGNGPAGQSGGGAGASPLGAGAGSVSGSHNGAVGQYGGGSGGFALNYGNTTGGTAGGGAGSYGKPGAGRLVIYFVCPQTGSIGTSHTLTYPLELNPDTIKSIVPATGGDTVYTWQQSPDGVKWSPTNVPDSAAYYNLEKDSIQLVTYFRRRASCGIYDSAWSNTVMIKMFNQFFGRNGVIKGAVQTRNGAVISGRKVYAQALTPVKGRSPFYLDSTITDGLGRFILDSVFYGDKTNGDSANVRFKVYADTSGGHLYNPGTVVLSLNTSNTSYDFTSQPFTDTSVFAITGKVYQVCSGCLDAGNNPATVNGALDSVRITGTGNGNKPGNNEIDSFLTNYANPPGEYGRYGLSFQASDTFTIVPKYQTHTFVPSKIKLYVNSNAGNLDFQDTITHVISGYFSAGCSDSIGSVTLEFDDVLPVGYDGNPRTSIFRKQVTTGAKGFYSVRLPGRKYRVSIVDGKINDPVDASLKLSAVTSFIGALPADSVTRDITNHDTTLNVVYKRAPQLQVAGLISPTAIFKCLPAYKNYAIWPQAQTRVITFNAFQGPVSKGCPLDSSTVVLYTSVQQQDNNLDTFTRHPLNGTDTLTLTAGPPYTLGAYRKLFTAYLYDQYGRQPVLNDTSTAVIVTGVSTDKSAQTFLTVTPQIPTMVLHDPPGNQSSSSWSTTTSSEQTISMSAQTTSTIDPYINIKIGTKEEVGLLVSTSYAVWANVSADLAMTNTSNNINSFTLGTSATHGLQTASDGSGIGPDADVFYGAAMNMRYTVGNQVDWDSLHCQFSKKPVMVFAADGINTTFAYTLAQIRDVQIPKLQLAAQVKPDSAAFFNNQISVWQQLLANNARNQQQAPVLSNVSFGSGSSINSSTTQTSTSTNTYSFSMEMNLSAALEVGFEYGGGGLNAGVRTNFVWTTGHDSTVSTTTQTTTGYTLQDNSKGDLFTVNIKKDPVYGTPMFETVAGESNCPHEANTIALDSMVISSNVPMQTGLAKDTAVFTFTAGNLSIDPSPRTYKVYLNQSSNPDGAFVFINGQAASQSSPVLLTINSGSQQKVTVNIIRNSAGGVYNYDNLEFVMTDNCSGDISRSVFISTDFASPVSGVTLVTPVNNWLVNTAGNNTLPVKFNGYDTGKLQTIAIEYDTAGTSNWLPVTTIFKTSLGSSAAGTTYNWGLAGINDGAYNLRLVLQDKNGRIVSTQPVTGLIDRKPPALFGKPQPTTGKYTAGAQISFSYTENINGNNLTAGMVQMTDLTAATTILVQLSAYANTLIVVPGSDISQYTGHNFRVVATGISDLNGNVKTTPDTLIFSAGATGFSTGTDAMNVTIGTSTLYEDATGAMDVHFTRKTKATGPTVIYYSIAGNAVNNQDYTLSYSVAQGSAAGLTGAQGAIVLPVDSTSVTLYIHPVLNPALAAPKTLSITLNQGGGYSYGSNYSVTATILNHAAAAPAITSFTPASAAKGATVTITGTGFTGATAVSFGGTAAASFKILTDTTITAVVSTGASGSVSVATPAGTATKAGFTFLTCTPVKAAIGITADAGPAICGGITVTFTAKAANGGTPVYQWYRSGIAAGTNSNKYKDAKLADGDSVYCVMTSTAGCLVANPVKSNTLVFTVAPRLIPALTITSDGGTTLCKGTLITLTATATNAGANPAYQWKKNGVVVGTNSTTYKDSTLKSNDQIVCVLTATQACVLPASATSKPLVFKVNPILAPVVTITPNITGMVCAGTHLIFTATVVNGGKATYKWYKNGVAAGGNSSATYAQNQLKDGDSVWCIITSVGACLASPTTKSNVYYYKVFSKNPPVLTITNNAGAGICPGMPITFMAATTDTITNPQYVWKRNNITVGANMATYIDSLPLNGDSISCTMTEQLPCAAGTAVSRAAIQLSFTTVSLPAQPTVISGPGGVAANQAGVAFTVTKVSGLTYNWVVPAGVTIVSGQGTFKLTVNWGTTAGNVSVTTANRCGSSPASIKKVTVAAGLRLDANNTDVSSSVAGNMLRVYPNPVTSIATIEFTAATVNKYEAQVMNQLGQLVTSRSGMTVQGLNTIQFNMAGLASATYYVRLVDTEHGTRIIKLVKAK